MLPIAGIGVSKLGKLEFASIYFPPMLIFTVYSFSPLFRIALLTYYNLTLILPYFLTRIINQVIIQVNSSIGVSILSITAFLFILGYSLSCSRITTAVSSLRCNIPILGTLLDLILSMLVSSIL